MDTSIFESVDQYIGNLFEDEDAVLKGTLKSMEDAGIPGINVSANQGKFLQILARLCGAKKILEIGTLGGYSTIWLARALPADGLLITLELEQAYADVARRNIIKAGLDSVVEIKVGKAMESLATLDADDEGPFDMIFIDADKPPYTEYFEWALKLSRPGTLIVADNVIREGKVLNDNCDDERVSGVQRFNKALAANQQVTATIIQTVGTKEHDGMAIAVVK
ncbi:O-methyltransferase [Mucilaginibacter sp. Mucisp84]|uniref:O-methyltransferase n=1 Tax=Mucilaginibacter sp. Mucisp84 TaxID=3243058 RepID=UPI0039A76227